MSALHERARSFLRGESALSDDDIRAIVIQAEAFEHMAPEAARIIEIGPTVG